MVRRWLRVCACPDSEASLEPKICLPSPAELNRLGAASTGVSTSLFAAKFREAAGRALLLPAGARHARSAVAAAQTRRRFAGRGLTILFVSDYAGDLSRMIRDVFDLPAAAANSDRDSTREHSRHHALNRSKPSPFASSLLFSYIANYIYEGDAPLAERRAQALSIDQSQLEEMLGDTDLRELLDRRRARRGGSAAAIARTGLPGAPRRWRPRLAVEAGRFDRSGNCRAQRVPKLPRPSRN